MAVRDWSLEAEYVEYCNCDFGCQWLYLNTLDSVSTLHKLIEFDVDEHNTRLPHSAFRGQTPNEMYFDTGNHIPKELEAARKAARESRMEVNRTASCTTCEQLTSISSQTDPTAAEVSS